ncbi:type I restriction endonuclease subunit S [Malaciobacter canalis]|uniref:Type I restriction endonuclease subunit S n=1 Tax=Malaciobacter canalis TaxID=1912871 RepID=A0ABX4LR60_9BACT|nr:restriction endonuclease subunit S [Malaciobacter canalis]PHO10213.1 type I restriction endonuclease subunit S [Malaciobacter canalis]QEE32703.1 type I restriction/modification system, specificity subunit [Malaciobacter canalis]
MKNEKLRVPKLRFREFSGEWEEKQIKDILIDYRLGGNYSNTENINKYPLIKMGNLDRGKIVLNKIEYIDEKEEVNQLDKIKYGDLFFNTRNTLELVGKVAIWRNELPIAYYNSNLMWMKYEDNFFMNYRFNTYQGIKSLRSIATGTTSVAAIYSKDLFKIKLIIPQKQEQEKIASFLSSIDKKINQLSKKDELLQNYKKAMMQKIFSQKLRFKKEDRSDYTKWEEKKLKEIATFFSGGTPSSTNKNYYNGDIPFIGSGKINSDNVEQFITSDALENSSAKMVNVGDLLYALYGATSGQVAISKIRGAINQAVLCIRSEENLAFLYFWLSFKQDNIISTYLQGGQGNLSAQIIKDLKINLPYIEEQTKIANFLSSLDTKISQNKKALEETQKFKKALLQKMFV